MFSSLNMRHMRSFVAVADHGSFTAAAGVLGVTPPSLTATIRQFEDVTGAALFDRTTRQVTLTDTGARFLPVARRLIGDFEEALGDLDALSKGIGGKITIAAAPSVLTRILPAVISRFVVDHPDARLRLDEMNAGEVHAAVAANEADFGIAGEWESLPDIAFRPLFSDRFGVLCRADHAFARQSFVTWAALSDQPFVGLGPESGTSAMMAGIAGNAGDGGDSIGGGDGSGGGGEGAGISRAGPGQQRGSDFTTMAIEQAATLGIARAKGVIKQAEKLATARNKLSNHRAAKAAKAAKSAGGGGAGAGAGVGNAGNAGNAALPMTLPRPTVETSNTLTLAAMVAQGVGITVLPELAARVSDMTRDTGLVFVPLSAPVRQRHIGIITRKSKSLSPIAALFLNQVREQAASLDLPAALAWY